MPPVPPVPDIPSDPNRYIPQEDDPSTILFDVPYAEAEWKADGIISDGEYQQMDIKASQLSYAASNGNMMDLALQAAVSLYMSYDENFVYIAATTPADNYICEIDSSNAYNMWAAHAVQLSLANINATDSAKRLETGYALSSLDNKLYSNTWFDPMGIHYDPEENVDYNIVNNGSTLVYEIRVPFEAFEKKKLTAGDSFLGSLAWAVGPTKNGGANDYAHIQLGYGVSGDPGKDPKGHATFTLGEKTDPEIVARGDCNDSISWTLDSKGLLTITGTGEMPNYDHFNEAFNPWYFEEVKSVIIEDGVTSIGWFAFA